MHKIGIVFALLLLCSAGLKYPIFEELDLYLSKHEGEKIPLYFVKIVGREGNVYHVETALEHKKASVVSSHDLKTGDVVSFYGEVRKGQLIAEKHRIHYYPNSPYPLSMLGFFLFSFLFLREWKFDARSLSFSRRE